MICCAPYLSKARLTLDSDAFKIGNSPYNSFIIHDKIGLEEWEERFNIWIPFGNPNYGNYKLFIDKYENIGIGKKPNGYKLDVAGDLYVAGRIVQTSDERLEQNIQNLSERNLLEKVECLTGKLYSKRSTLRYLPEVKVDKMVITPTNLM